jgi:serine/threonine protein kinase
MQLVMYRNESVLCPPSVLSSLTILAHLMLLALHFVGFTYLILELMDADFWTIAPALAKTKKAGTIDVAPIAERLVAMVEAVHGTGHLLVDIKPENFMLAAASTKKGAVTAESLAGLMRVLDLGLFQMYKDHCGHRPNEKGGDLQGTPLYASLNVHSGETPSRRDDVESLLYVIMELVIRTHAAVSGTVATYERNKNDPTYLPWSQEGSDDATGAAKRAMVENPSSELYRRMPAPAAKILFKCLQSVQSMKYKKEPLYADVANALANLTIPATATAASKKKAAPVAKRAAPVTAASKKKAAAAAAAAALEEPSPPAKRAAPAAAASKKKKAAATLPAPTDTPTRRSLRSAVAVAVAPSATATTGRTRYGMVEGSDSSDSEEEEESPPKKRKTADYAVMDVDEESDEEEEVEVADEEDNFYDADAQSEPEEMDVDMDEVASSPDENRKPPAKSQQGITLSFKTGPLKDQVFSMIQSENETVIVGYAPVPKANASVLEIGDDTLGASHVKLQLESQRKNHWRVQVTDLKPKNGGTTINTNAIPSGKTQVVMPGQTVQFGKSRALVLAYNGAKADVAVAEPERAPTGRKRNVAAAIDNSPQVVEEIVKDTKPAAVPMEVVKKNATARLVVTAGPHTGEEYFLGKGASKKIVFGTKPSTKAKDVDIFALPQASNMKANHARLDFVGNKHCLKINVTNLSKGDTFINVDPVSKDRVAFSGQTITMGDTVMRVESVST